MILNQPTTAVMPLTSEFILAGRQFEAHFLGPWLKTSEWASIIDQSDRFDDICGQDISAILRKTGWTYSGVHPGAMIILFDCSDPELKTPVAAGVCQSIVESKTKQCGLNISYFCRVSHEGLGLSKLATALSVLHALSGVDAEAIPMLEFANIQCRQSNERAWGLAQRLGMAHQPSLDFMVPKRPDLSFRTYRSTPYELRVACQQIVDSMEFCPDRLEQQQGRSVCEMAPC